VTEGGAVKIGLHVTSFTWPGEPESIAGTFAEIAHAADEGGFYSMSVMDHFFQMEMAGLAEEPMLEAYSALNYLAGITERVRLAALVTGVVYRHPGLLIKAVTTLDVLSRGRAELGIGAAWYEREAKGLGAPFPPLKERFERLDETLQIAHQMWNDDPKPFHGKHYQLEEPINHPRPVSRPHPPIMIGGMGEKKTLRLVAQHADATNLFAFGPAEEISRKLMILRQHCERAGRDYDSIERTALTAVDLRTTPVADAIARCRDLANTGIQRLILMVPNVQEVEPVRRIGRELIPAVAEFAA
jgi:F420-dependent oxidoreductase-like protein